MFYCILVLAGDALIAFEALRIYKPRMLICGQEGMGQNAIAAAVLHHLEGYHVQSMDLGTLVSDSTRVSLYFASTSNDTRSDLLLHFFWI